MIDTKILRPCLLLILTMIINNAYCEKAVIVHPSNNTPISISDIQRLYTAKVKVFPGGLLAIPLNHKASSTDRNYFEKTVLKQDSYRLKAYWAKLIFTGKERPLKQIRDDAEALQKVAETPGAIAYIDAANVNNQVKVIFTY